MSGGTSDPDWDSGEVQQVGSSVPPPGTVPPPPAAPGTSRDGIYEEEEDGVARKRRKGSTRPLDVPKHVCQRAVNHHQLTTTSAGGRLRQTASKKGTSPRFCHNWCCAPLRQPAKKGLLNITASQKTYLIGDVLHLTSCCMLLTSVAHHLMLHVADLALQLTSCCLLLTCCIISPHVACC